MRMVSGAGHYSTTTLYGQRLLDKPPLSTAWQSRISETWLPVNDYGYTSHMEAMTKVRLSLYVVDALPGYLVAGTKNQIGMLPQSNNQMDGLFLLIPQLNGRDLADLYIERWENQEWLRSVSTLYRPLSGVTQVAVGQSSVTIGSNGFAEWRKLPTSGSLSISGASM